MGEDLPWIPAALSTIKLATSPRLSAIKLRFPHQPDASGSVEVTTRHTGNDLRRVADEVTRIESEFRGTLSLTVLRYPAFEVVSDTLDVRPHCCRAGGLANSINVFVHSLQFRWD